MTLKVGGLYRLKNGFKHGRNCAIFLYLGSNKLVVMKENIFRVEEHSGNEAWLLKQCEVITDGT